MELANEGEPEPDKQIDSLYLRLIRLAWDLINQHANNSFPTFLISLFIYPCRRPHAKWIIKLIYWSLAIPLKANFLGHSITLHRNMNTWQPETVPLDSIFLDGANLLIRQSL